MEMEQGKVRLRNRAWYLDGQGLMKGRYDKMHLVPFGEYVPLKKLFFFAGKLVAEVGDFTPGPERNLFSLGGERFGTVICYEIIFPDLVRRFVRDGAGFMTAITNDAWYGTSSASWQHFTQMVFRAVENGVPFARAANTGISGFVDASGRVVEASPLFVRGFYIRKISPGRGTTFYTRHGDLLAYLCLLVLAGWVLAVATGRRRRNYRT
jgi:apolipoprotein N-acyltransferase